MSTLGRRCLESSTAQAFHSSGGLYGALTYSENRSSQAATPKSSAIPKSVSFICNVSLIHKIFPGFTSRWRTLIACSACKAACICKDSTDTLWLLSGPSTWITCSNDVPPYSKTMKGKGFLFESVASKAGNRCRSCSAILSLIKLRTKTSCFRDCSVLLHLKILTAQGRPFGVIPRTTLP